MSKYNFHRFLVDGTRLTAGDVHEFYGVSIDDLLDMRQGDRYDFTVGQTVVRVTKL